MSKSNISSPWHPAYIMRLQDKKTLIAKINLSTAMNDKIRHWWDVSGFQITFKMNNNQIIFSHSFDCTWKMKLHLLCNRSLLWSESPVILGWWIFFLMNYVFWIQRQNIWELIKLYYREPILNFYSLIWWQLSSQIMEMYATSNQMEKIMIKWQ